MSAVEKIDKEVGPLISSSVSVPMAAQGIPLSGSLTPDQQFSAVRSDLAKLLRGLRILAEEIDDLAAKVIA